MIAAFVLGIVALVCLMVGFAWCMDYLMRNGSE